MINENVFSLKLFKHLSILANIPILHPLKIPEMLWFSGVFRGYKMGTRNWLIRCTDEEIRLTNKNLLKCAKQIP